MGHLARVLAFKYGFSVTCVEQDPLLTAQAKYEIILYYYLSILIITGWPLTEISYCSSKTMCSELWSVSRTMSVQLLKIIFVFKI